MTCLGSMTWPKARPKSESTIKDLMAVSRFQSDCFVKHLSGAFIPFLVYYSGIDKGRHQSVKAIFNVPLGRQCFVRQSFLFTWSF